MRLRFFFPALVGLAVASPLNAQAQQPASAAAAAAVVNAAALEQPPEVIAGSCQQPSYPPLLRSSQIEGRVILEFVVDTTGRVEPASVTTISSSHSQFERAARQALMTCRYRPATFNDQLTRVMVRLPYTFTIGRR